VVQIHSPRPLTSASTVVGRCEPKSNSAQSADSGHQTYGQLSNRRPHFLCRGKNLGAMRAKIRGGRPENLPER